MEIHGTVYDILHNKSGEILTTRPEDSVYDAIRLMGEKNIGALVAMENGEVVGVLSERDYSRKVVLQGRTSRDTRVGEIISRPAITVRSRDGIEKCHGRPRHLGDAIAAPHHRATARVHLGRLPGLIDWRKWCDR